MFFNNFLFSLSALSLLLFLSACSETKSSQCQKIIAITKKVAQESESYRQSQDLEQVLKVADVFERGAANLDSVKLADERLADSQQDLAEIYRGNATSTRQFIAAVKDKNIPGARAMQQQVRSLGATEKELVREINHYCQEDGT